MVKFTIPKSKEDWLLLAATATLAAFSFYYAAYSLGYAQEHLNTFKGFLMGLFVAVAITRMDQKIARKDEIIFLSIIAITMACVGLHHIGILSEITMNAVFAAVGVSIACGIVRRNIWKVK